jgi:hypothetical protein
MTPVAAKYGDRGAQNSKVPRTPVRPKLPAAKARLARNGPSALAVTAPSAKRRRDAPQARPPVVKGGFAEDGKGGEEMTWIAVPAAS